MILIWLLLASGGLCIIFLLVSPPPTAAGDFFRQGLLPEEVPCVPLTQKKGAPGAPKEPTMRSCGRPKTPPETYSGPDCDVNKCLGSF